MKLTSLLVKQDVAEDSVVGKRCQKPAVILCPGAALWWVTALQSQPSELAPLLRGITRGPGEGACKRPGTSKPAQILPPEGLFPQTLTSILQH